MKVSERLISKIKELEGFRANAYDDRGRKAIGYGDTKGDTSKTISEAEADLRLRRELDSLASEVNSTYSRKFNQDQFDSIVDMHYNIGGETLKSNGFIDFVDRADDESIRNKILEYNKSTNPTTGRKEVLPGLVSRAEFRANLWSGDPTSGVSLTSTAGDMIGDKPTDDGLFGFLGETRKEEEAAAPQSQDINTELSNFLTGSDSEPATVADRTNGILEGEAAFTPEEIQKDKIANGLMKEFDLSKDEALGVLGIMEADEYRLQKSAERISTVHPKLATWALDPYNRELLKKSADKLERLDTLVNRLNPNRSDVSKAFENSLKHLERGTIHLRMATKQLSIEEGIKLLRDMDSIPRASYRAETIQGIQEIQKASEERRKPSKRFLTAADISWQYITGDDEIKKKLIPQIRKTYKGSDEEFDAFIASVMETGKSAVEATLAYIKWLGVMATNPESYLAQSAESLAQTGLPMAVNTAALGTGAALSLGQVAIGGPAAIPTAALTMSRAAKAGAIGAGFTGAAVEFGAKVDEILAERFSNPLTGVIDYERALNDPDTLRDIQKEAAIYGSIMGASDAALSWVQGRLFTKGAKSKTVKGVAAGVVAEGAASAVTETAAVATAEVSTQVAMGREVTKDFLVDTAQKSTEEGAMGFGMGAAFGTISGTARLVGHSRPVTSVIGKIKKTVEENNKAQEDVKNFKDAKAEATDSDLNNESSVSDLVDDIVTPPVPEEARTEVQDSPEGDASAALANDVSSLDGKVRLKPSDLVNYAASKGLSVPQVLNIFGGDFQQKFNENAMTDSSIPLPLSDFLEASKSLEDIEDIARFNDNDFSADEATVEMDEYQEDPLKDFNVLSTPKDSGTDVESVADSQFEVTEEFSGPYDIDEEAEESITASSLDAKHRVPDERKAYATTATTVNSALKGTTLTQEAKTVIADIQFRRLRQRAEALGADVQGLANDFKLAAGKSNKSAAGMNLFTKMIVFTKDVNAIQVIHELAHTWLEELADDYAFLVEVPYEEMNNAQREYFSAMETAAKNLGIDNMGVFANMDLNTERAKLHEQFAMSAEKYFLEGKFENNAIKHVMERFRKYFLEFIDAVAQAYRGIPTFAITPEVERMFEYILGTSETAQHEIGPFAASMDFDTDILGKGAKNYFEAIQNAQDETVSDMVKKVANKTFKEREAFLREFRKAAREQATEEVDATPAMRIRNIFLANHKAFLARQREAKAKDVKFTEKHQKISFKSFAGLVGSVEKAREYIKNKQVPNFMVANEHQGGVDASAYDALMGSPTDVEMLMILLEAGQRDERIESREEAILEEQNPMLKTDREITDEAIASVSFAGEKAVAKRHLRVLADHYLGTLLGTAQVLISPTNARKAKYIKAVAENRVRKTKLRDFSVKKFLLDYKTQARDAGRSFKAGRMVEAYNSKAASLVSLEARDVALKMAKAIEATKRQAKLLNDRLVSRDTSFDPEVLAFGIAAEDAVRNKKPIPLFRKNNILAESSGVTFEIENIINLAVTDFNMNYPAGMNGNDMTVGAEASLGRLLRTINSQARAARNLELGNRRITRDNAILEVSNEIANSQSAIVDYTSRVVGGYRSMMHSVSTGLYSLYESVEAALESTGGMLLDRLRLAEANATLEKEEVQGRVQTAIKTLYDKVYSKDARKQKYLAPLADGSGLSPILETSVSANDTISGGTFFPNLKFNNIWELLTAELLMGSESGARRLLFAGVKLDGRKESGALAAGLTLDEGMKRWEDYRADLVEKGILRKEHFDLMGAIWAEFEAIHPRATEVIRKNDGYFIGNIRARKVKTPFGDYTGGYYPLSVDPDSRNQLDPDGSGMTQYLLASQMYPMQKDNNLTESRAEDGKPVRLDFTKLFSYLDATLDVIHMRESLKAMGQVYSSPEVRNALEEKRPGFYDNVLVPWFNRTATQTYTARNDALEPFNAAALFLRKAGNAAIYSANLGSALIQTTGAAPAMADVGVINMASSLLDQVLHIGRSDNPDSPTQKAFNNSAFMRTRRQAVAKKLIRDFAIPETSFSYLGSEFLAKVRNVGLDKVPYALIHPVQLMTDISVWNAAVDKYVAKYGNGDMQKAYRYADEIVRNTQGDPAVSSLPNILAGSNAFKLLTMAMSYPINIYNSMNQRIKRNPELMGQAMDMVRLGMFYAAMPALLEAGIREALDQGFQALFGEDDEDEARKKAELRNKRLITNTVGVLLPGVDRVLDVGIDQNAGAISPAIRVLGDVMNTPINLKDAMINEVPMSTNQIRMSLRALSIYTQLPFNVLARELFVEEVLVKGIMDKDPEDLRLDRNRALRDLRRD